MSQSLELKSGRTILFIGDSITDAGRGQRAYRPFGFGYVHFIAYDLLARFPGLNLNIINTGISGDTILDLQRRWKADCLAHKPDILSVLIGINDVWSRYSDIWPGAESVEDDVSYFESTYRSLLSQAREKCNCQIILMHPFMFCQDLENRVFAALGKYIEVVEKMTQEFSAVLVPLQTLINKEIAQISPERWSEDSVHPYTWSHAWISQRWFEATGL
jgi:acyl-CoA thioesterase I